jgi:hypothetical protein
MDSQLPKGFRYNKRNYVILKNKILAAFIEKSNSIFNDIVEFPPVGYASTFKKGANIIGDKVYEFQDKKKRELVLTPDPLNHLFNFYSQQYNYKNPCRISWISPTFRYRNIPDRFFYQIGVSSLNFNEGSEVIELFLCFRHITEFICSQISKDLKIKIINPGLTHEIVGKTYGAKKSANLFEYIRLNKNKFLTELTQQSNLNQFQSDLKCVLFGESNSFAALKLLKAHKEARKTLDFLKMLPKNIEYELALDDFYCSEILSGLGFILYLDNKKIADGGIYSKYGSRCSDKISNVISVCTGINPLIRNYNINSHNIRIQLQHKVSTETSEKSLELIDEFYHSQYQFTLHAKLEITNIMLENFDLIVQMCELSDEGASGNIVQQNNRVKFSNLPIGNLMLLINDVLKIKEEK